MSEIHWEETATGRLLDWEEGLALRLRGFHMAPRWNGLPCRWYICAFCDFQIQLGARLPSDALLPPDRPTSAGERAMGRYIIHKCKPGLTTNVQDIYTRPQPGYAYLRAPWQAIDGLQVFA